MKIMPNSASPLAGNASALATALVLLALWEAGVRLYGAQFEFLPAPTQIATALYRSAYSGQLAADSLHTIACALAGWFIAVLIGAGAGLALAFSRTADRFLSTSVEVLRPLPAVAFVPVAVLLLGFTVYTEVLVIVYASLWPLIVNVMGGARSLHQRLFDTAATLHLTRTQRLTKIILPAVLPSIIVGARVALGLALVVAVLVEMIGNPAGLGWGLVTAQEALQPDLMFGYLVMTGVLGVFLNTCLRLACKWSFPGIREIQDL
jgi:ABC-type nitrate/sulfonate/bicarbonate transport system permease component